MAKYAIGLRNVRTKGSPIAEGTKDVPAQLSTELFSVITDTTAPDAAACNAAVATLLPGINDSAIGTALAAGIANATVRADETTGAYSFRWGKGFYQLGVGYHASADADAIASVNWKDLS